MTTDKNSLQGVFTGVIGADSMGDVCKPEKAAFQRAFEISGADPRTSAMFEDSFKNLRTAKALGMTTILVAGETAAEENVTKYALSCSKFKPVIRRMAQASSSHKGQLNHWRLHISC